MESHAIRKPSGSAGLAPAAAAQGAAPPRRERDDQQQQHAPAPPRAPVIIYDASPKVIHAKPSEFMAIVQSLTGPGSGTPQQQRQERPRCQADDDGDDDDVLLLDQAAAAFLPPELLLSPSAAMSPAARLATIERSVRPAPDHDAGVFPGADDGTLAAVLGPLARHPSILSPLPSALPPAAASGLFSPLPFDPSDISWLNELNPIF